MNGQRSVRLFRVGGVDVAVDLSWIVIFLLVLWSLSSQGSSSSPVCSAAGAATASAVACAKSCRRSAAERADVLVARRQDA
ncbi:MAG TPA: hypothetical protein VGK20_03310 [Candidatus Binatia bacterium]|jgi:hypothetical protein